VIGCPVSFAAGSSREGGYVIVMPKIDRRNLKKPLCYDPQRKKFIFYREIAAGREPIIMPELLTPEEQKLLVAERQRKGPDYTLRSISGRPYTRDEVVEAILTGTELGRMAVEAEVSMLKELLREIEKNLLSE